MNESKLKETLLSVKEDLNKRIQAVDFLLNFEKPRFEEIPFPMVINDFHDVYMNLSSKAINRLKYFLEKDDFYLKNMPTEDIASFDYELFRKCRDVGNVTFNEIETVFKSKLNYMI